MKVACTVYITNSEESTKLILKTTVKCTHFVWNQTLLLSIKIKNFEDNNKIVREIKDKTND